MAEDKLVNITFTGEELNLVLQAIQGAWKSGAVQARNAAESIISLEDKLKKSLAAQTSEGE